jgi:response regulator of citrate/malate metabolism
MAEGLDVIVVDDDPQVCQILSDIIKDFYVWGEVVSYVDVDEAIAACLSREIGLALFVVDVFLGGKSGFFFLDALEKKFPSVYEDTILITGKASDDIVDMCVASNVNYLLEKPIKAYALQLAVRSLVTKYIHFSKKLLRDPAFAESVAKM